MWWVRIVQTDEMLKLGPFSPGRKARVFVENFSQS
jgi:hypothetical protein